MTDTLTHALTIHQPWAWAVAAGHKPVENRTWRPPLEAVGKLIGIHAGLKPHPDYGTTQLAWDRQRVGIPRPEDGEWVTGALIGVARLVGVLRVIPGDPFGAMERVMGRARLGIPVATELAARIRPWWRGPWGWLLEEAVLLPEPIPMRGQQGLWRIPDVVMGPQNTTLAVAYHPGEFAARALEQWRKARETR